jgi:hypothetical protein
LTARGAVQFWQGFVLAQGTHTVGDAFIGSFAYDVNTAIGLATAAAHRDRHNGLDVMVCVQQPDGHCQKVWP